MARVARRVLERRQARLLLVVLQHTGDDGLARMSNSQFAAAMGLTVEQVRNACRALVSKGLLESRPQYLYNGAQVENAYNLTAQGHAQVAALLSEEKHRGASFPLY